MRAAFLAVVVSALVTAQPLSAQPGYVAVADPAAVGVLVLNGTRHHPSLASHVSSSLTKRGFVVRHLARPWVANAPRAIRITRIYFDPSQPRLRLAARLLEQHVRGQTMLAGLPTKRVARLLSHAPRVKIVLVLGASFAGVR